MARMRIVKPGFFTNEEIAELPPLTRLLFVGLWTVADRRGRLEDRPKRIKAELMPYDDHPIDAALNDLHLSGFIVRYIVDQKKYIQINKFEKHQHCHVKEPESTIPAPFKTGANPSLTGTITGTITEQEQEQEQEQGLAGNVLSDNAWTLFLSVFPKRNGKHLDLETAREEFDRFPAKWNQWIAAAKNYAMSEGVKNNIGICNALTFLKKNWSDWQEPERVEGNGNGSQNGGSQRRARNFGDERDAERKARLARVCGGGNRAPGDFHRPAVVHDRNSTLEGEVVEIPEVETS